MLLTQRKDASMQATRSGSRWLTLAAVVFAVFVTTLDNTVVNVALPSIQRDFRLDLSGLTWIVNAYVLSFAVLLLTGGRVADSWGRRRTVFRSTCPRVARCAAEKFIVKKARRFADASRRLARRNSRNLCCIGRAEKP